MQLKVVSSIPRAYKKAYYTWSTLQGPTCQNRTTMKLDFYASYHNITTWKRILQYLKRTIDLGIQLTKVPEFNLFDFADAEFSSDNKSDPRCTLRNILFTNGPISWS